MEQKTFIGKLKWLSAKIIWHGIAILLGICTFAGVAEFSRDVTSNSIFIFVLTLMLFPLLTLVHEMGHALAAWACKCRVHFIAVGRFGFDPENRKFRKHSEKISSRIDGFVQYSPFWSASRRWTEIVVSLGGPLITLILGLGLLYRFLLFGYEPSYPNANTGYMWLGFACVLHTIMNLLPLKIDQTFNTDGRNIWNSLFASVWTLESWMETRAFISSAYEQEIATDEEWLLLRRQTISARQEEQVTVEDLMRYFAWAKTDPEAFMAVIDSGATHIAWLPKDLQNKYVASAVLMGAYEPRLGRLIQDTVYGEEEDACSILWHFARVLRAYAEGDKALSRLAVAGAREAYISAYGDVGVEEEAIFCAVETGETLPALKWPSFRAAVKQSPTSNVAVRKIALA